MATFLVPVSWTMVGAVEVEAETLTEAVETAYTLSTSDCVDEEYLAGSWSVDDIPDESFGELEPVKTKSRKVKTGGCKKKT